MVEVCSIICQMRFFYIMKCYHSAGFFFKLNINHCIMWELFNCIFSHDLVFIESKLYFCYSIYFIPPGDCQRGYIFVVLLQFWESPVTLKICFGLPKEMHKCNDIHQIYFTFVNNVYFNFILAYIAFHACYFECGSVCCSRPVSSSGAGL